MAPVVTPAFEAIVRSEAFIKPLSRNSFFALSRSLLFVSTADSLINSKITVLSKKINKVKLKNSPDGLFFLRFAIEHRPPAALHTTKKITMLPNSIDKITLLSL